MTSRLLGLAVFAALAGTALCPVNAGAAQPTDLGLSADLQDELRDSFIFVFSNDVPASETGKRAQALTTKYGGSVRYVYSTALRGFSAKMPAATAEHMVAQNPMIAYYEADGVAYGVGKHASIQPQTSSQNITRVGGPLNGTGLTAWIVDSGIDLENADLNVDVARSANFITRGKDSPDDGHGHGTHVAGILAAIDNEIDVVGVAAGATVVAVRVLDNDNIGPTSGVIAGVDYVAANGAPGDVVNMSLTDEPSQALDDAVTGAASLGLKFAIAAGNSTTNASGFSPGRVEHPNVWTVSATDNDDNFMPFSNYGNPPVDCAAPGLNVPSLSIGGGVETRSGTSMSAPHVAGLLLFGTPGADGTAVGDPDGTPDPICHF